MIPAIYSIQSFDFDSLIRLAEYPKTEYGISLQLVSSLIILVYFICKKASKFYFCSRSILI